MGPVAEDIEDGLQETVKQCAAHIAIAFVLQRASAECLSGSSVDLRRLGENLLHGT